LKGRASVNGMSGVLLRLTPTRRRRGSGRIEIDIYLYIIYFIFICINVFQGEYSSICHTRTVNMPIAVYLMFALLMWFLPVHEIRPLGKTLNTKQQPARLRAVHHGPAHTNRR
jgi:hypothetical protein